MLLQVGCQDLALAPKPGLALRVAVHAAERKVPMVPKETGMAGSRAGWGVAGGQEEQVPESREQASDIRGHVS